MNEAEEESRMRKIAKMLACGAALLLSGTAVQAHPHNDGDKAEASQVKKIVIHKRDGSTSEVDVDAAREKAMLAASEHCKGKRAQIDENDKSGADGKTNKSRIVVCAPDDGTLIAALEKARTQIGEEKMLSDAQREKVIASLDKQIEQLRAGGANK
ncbi:hypothetical protein [Sphingomonas colocasiae]|uniref:Uncharacterized protein n=1 Tax=Sphingomonas colocasiae TaxID=1848973 RepID=A0ABS7PJM0_9SPHN|nr:hypothetical protein [Sphingomonas colocasiae]MBY8821487.1 hypothetical protein [Sphingomonas colocasiae]